MNAALRAAPACCRARALASCPAQRRVQCGSAVAPSGVASTLEEDQKRVRIAQNQLVAFEVRSSPPERRHLSK